MIVSFDGVLCNFNLQLMLFGAANRPAGFWPRSRRVCVCVRTSSAACVGTLQRKMWHSSRNKWRDAARTWWCAFKLSGASFDCNATTYWPLDAYRYALLAASLYFLVCDQILNKRAESVSLSTTTPGRPAGIYLYCYCRECTSIILLVLPAL